jgi:sulfur relay (sulfurtransferase) DsrF/TusC family protein
MNPKVLFIVTGDPRTSPRPAEALRIAAGVGVWKKTEIAVYLRGDAILALGESGGELMDEEDCARYWTILKEFSQPIYAQKNAAELRKIGRGATPFKEISGQQLAELASEQTSVLRF